MDARRNSPALSEPQLTPRRTQRRARGRCGAFTWCRFQASVKGSRPASSPPKHLADKILTSRAALEGERKQVTVLFADVKGSMELAEQLDPEAFSKTMQRFFLILSEGVEGFEGFVDPRGRLRLAAAGATARRARGAGACPRGGRRRLCWRIIGTRRARSNPPRTGTEQRRSTRA